MSRKESYFDEWRMLAIEVYEFDPDRFDALVRYFKVIARA